ncbi:MAG: hypothetical protein KDA57_23380, partial [Planctomycetales bacterium]|nr:hypothetical protein [Planctomycetales bacterium]
WASASEMPRPIPPFYTVLGCMLTEATYQTTEAGRPFAEPAQRPPTISAYSVSSMTPHKILDPQYNATMSRT